MGEVKRTTAEIQAEIDRVRDNLARDIHALEVTVREKLDWRKPIRDQPLAYFGAALGLGFLVGIL